MLLTNKPTNKQRQNHNIVGRGNDVTMCRPSGHLYRRIQWRGQDLVRDGAENYTKVINVAYKMTRNNTVNKM